MLQDQPVNVHQFTPSETGARVKSDGLQPEFRLVVIPFDMDVRGFMPVPGVKEKTIWARTQNSRHIWRVMDFTVNSKKKELRPWVKLVMHVF